MLSFTFWCLSNNFLVWNRFGNKPYLNLLLFVRIVAEDLVENKFESFGSCHSWELMKYQSCKQNSIRNFSKAIGRENCFTQKDHLEMSLIRTCMSESFFCHAERNKSIQIERSVQAGSCEIYKEQVQDSCRHWRGF